MGINELYELLKTIRVDENQLPIAYHHFTTPNQVPPFIVYSIESYDSLKADDKVHCLINNYLVDLCTDIKNESLELQIEQLFDDNHIPYDKEESYIDSERIYQIRYFI